MEYEVVAKGLHFPEGPVALIDGSVVLVEIETGCITHVDARGSKSVVANVSGGPNGAALGPDGKLYVCNCGGFEFFDLAGGRAPGHQPKNYAGGSIQRIDLKTGGVETIYTHAGSVRLCGPNDLVFDNSGGFWFTDQGKSRDRDKDSTGVFYAKADGSFIEEVLFPVQNSNGIGLSPDGRRLYVAESYTCMLWAFDLPMPGKVTRNPKGSPFGEMLPHGGTFLFRPAGFKLFDSLGIEESGNICVGTLGTAGITVVSPAGEELEFIALPDMLPTNICWGGKNMRTAYITLSLSGQLIAAQWPRPGLVLNYADTWKG